MKKVGIIGGSGFIGSYVTKEFLNNSFEVKASTTNILNEGKYEHLMLLKHSENLHICELDVLNKTALKQFVADCDIVVHAGTPFQLNVNDAENELLNPTIKGTENILKVINESPGIEKLVLIASVAAWNTNFPMPAGAKSDTESFDEKDNRFTSTESHPYARAKFNANQVVINYIKSHSNLDFEITTISPVMVMGKSLSKREDSISTGIQFLIKNKLAPDEFMQGLYKNNVILAIVDVEDVASAVFIAATKNGLHAKDYLLSSESYKILDVVAMLNQKKPQEKARNIYQNQLVQNVLNIRFKPVKLTLNNFEYSI